jgi:hypothetical protein
MNKNHNSRDIIVGVVMILVLSVVCFFFYKLIELLFVK